MPIWETGNKIDVCHETGEWKRVYELHYVYARCCLLRSDPCKCGRDRQYSSDDTIYEY